MARYKVLRSLFYRGFLAFSHRSKQLTATPILLWAGVMGLAVAIGVPMLCFKTPQSSAQFSQRAVSAVLLPTIRVQAQAITVKVMSEGGQGSGILVKSQAATYTVLTNQHVILSDQQIRVQTPDRKIYPAMISSKINFKGNDLALLQFQASAGLYQVASFGHSGNLQKGERVFATGFPNEGEPANSDGFRFTEGRISIFAPKSLQGGYRLGYTNDVVKGMSGGPVINALGQVVAVNGMHAYPLWGDPYIYLDGTRPEASLQTQMTKLSWAIPIETAIQFASGSLQ